MKPIEIIAQDLFDKVRSRFSNLQMGDETGAVTASPKDARFFDFDFVVEENNLGRVSISINETGKLKVFYSQGITENVDGITQSIWYDFLREMRYFAKRRLLRFDTRDITKGNLDKNDFQYLAQNGPKDNTMNESSMFGSLKTSHRKLENTDLIIRHTEAIDPEKPGSRSRKIKNLFIQNEEGERFKFPFIYLPGARAMQRHVANGGYPHDEVGKHIIGTCEEILKLSDFGRKVKHATLNDNAHQIAEKAGVKLKSLRHHLECMGRQGYYESWKESYAPNDDLVELDDATMESYKDTFTQNKFDEELLGVFPLLHKIMQEESEIDLENYIGEKQEEECSECGLPESQCGCSHESMEDEDKLKEFVEFDSWATELVNESFSDEELQALEELVQEPLPVGANDEAVQTLAGIGIKDPALVKALRATAAMPNGADADAREIIKAFLGNDATKINWGDMATDAAPQSMPPQEPVEPVEPAAPEAMPAQQPAMAEGYYLGPEDFQEWLKDATHRVAQGKVDDWTELYSELVSDLGFDENKAERIAKRIYTHDTLSQYRVKPEDDAEKEISKDGEDDDDDSFLAKLRGQAKTGSIKPNADVDEEDVMQHDDDDKLIEPENPKSALKKVAELVMGFYDREKGTWTKGEHGVVTHVKRQFSNDEGKGGEKEAELAAKLIAHLNAQHHDKKAVEEMRRLAGLPIV